MAADTVGPITVRRFDETIAKLKKELIRNSSDGHVTLAKFDSQYYFAALASIMHGVSCALEDKLEKRTYDVNTPQMKILHTIQQERKQLNASTIRQRIANSAHNVFDRAEKCIASIIVWSLLVLSGSAFAFSKIEGSIDYHKKIPLLALNRAIDLAVELVHQDKDGIIDEHELQNMPLVAKELLYLAQTF